MPNNHNQTKGAASKLIIGLSAVVLVVVGLLFLTMRTDGITSANGSEASEVASSSKTEEVTPPTLPENGSETASSSASTTESEAGEGSDVEGSEAETKPNQNTDPFAVNITAQSAIVMNSRSGEVLYAKSPDSEEPLASLTKLMTAFVGAEKATGMDSATTTISAQHLKALGNTGLRAEETWEVNDLISYMLIESSNDAARAVAAAATDDQADGYAEDFIDDMNQTAENLGLTVTYFFNPSGLDLNETLVSGGYGSARDTARLMSRLIATYPEIARMTTKPSEVFNSLTGTRYAARNTNTWLPRFSNVTASKTGYTVLAGGNLAMGFDLAEPVTIVVLGSSRAERFEDMLTLYNATNAYFANQSQ